MGITYLHNFLRQSKTSRQVYTPAGSLDNGIDGNLVQGSWRQDGAASTALISLKPRPRKSKTTARDNRAELTEYFNNNPLP